MRKFYPAISCCLLLLALLFTAQTGNGQSCTGSLGDPIFKETFGDAGTTVKPTLGPPLPPGITTYTYYSPQTVSRPVGPYPGQYTISNTTRGYNNTYFVDRPDHTSGTGTGYCMVVDANATPDKFYERTITGLCAGTTFEFSAWIMNINPQAGVSQPSLRFDIVDANNPNGAPIISVSTGNVPYQSPGTWVREAGVFQMPSTTSSVILRIFSNTPSSNGNDLALDDIAFAACGPPITFTQGAGTICYGGTGSLNVSLPAGSYSNYFFQLQNRPLGTTNWTNVGGVVNNGGSNSRTFTISNAQGGYEYRVLAAGGTAEINSANCRVTSSPVELKVIDFVTSITGTTPVCYNTSTTLTASTTPNGTGNPTTGFTYLWESSPNGTGNWTTVNGQTGATLNTGPLTSNTYYRVTATVSGCSGRGVSQVFPVTVYPQITASVPAQPSLCQGTATYRQPYAITSGTANRYSVTSTDMPGFAAVNNATLTSSPLNVVIPANLAPGTYHLNFTFGSSTTGCTSPVYTQTVVIVAQPTVPNAGNDTTICNSNTMNLAGNTPTSGTGTWTQESGPNNVTFSDVHNGQTQISGLQPGTYRFLWTIGNSVCTAVSDEVVVTVLAAPTAANAGPDQVQYNTGVFVMQGNTPTVGSGTWTVISGNATLSNASNPNTNATIAPNTAATLVWSISNGVCPPTRDTVVIRYISAADIQIFKTIPENGPYIAGQDFVYRIVAINAGPSNATAVHITDPLPSSFIASSVNVTVTGAANLISNNSTLTNVDVTADIPTGGATVTIIVTGKLSSALNGDITNTATAVSPNVPDTNGAVSTITVPVIRRPYINIVKQAPANAIAGGPIQFSVVANNTGLGDAVNTVITDAVSSQVSSVSWTAIATGKATIVSGATGTGNNLSITASMPAGDTGKIYISITGTVTPGATGNILNQAIATPAEPGSTPFPSNTTTTVISSTPGLVITKTHTGNVILTAGLPVEYIVKLMNNGPSNAVGTVITDNIPAAVLNPTWTTDVQGAATVTSGATGSGSNLSMTVNIPAGASNAIIIHIKGTVNPDFTGTLSNTASAQPAEPNVPAVFSTDQATVNPVVKFTIVKNGPATAAAGSTITYTVDVTNEGPSNAKHADISDIIPPALFDVSWTASVTSGTATINSGATGTGNNVSVDANMNAGASIRVIITGTIQPPLLVPIHNTAEVTPSEPNTPPVTSNEVITTINAQAKLHITKMSVDTASAGGNITYGIVVTNSGPSNARGLTITDIVPSQIQNVTWTAVGVGNAAVLTGASGSGNNLTVTGDLGAGSSNSIAITVSGTIASNFAGTLTNNATVKPSEPNSTGDTATKTTVVNRLPKLSITKSAADGVLAGDSLTYTITVTNTGQADAIGTVITDTIPASLLGGYWTSTTTGAATVTNGGSGSGRFVRLTANIPAGSSNSVVITIKAKTDPGIDTTLINRATATPAEPVPPVSASKTVRVRKIPVVSISKAGPAQLDAGEQIVYTLLITNIGVSNANNLLISDVIPVQVQNPTWQATANGSAQVVANGTGAGNNLGVTVNIPAGQGNSVSVVITGKVDPAFSGSFTNGATAIPAESGSVPASSNQVTTTVSQRPNIHVMKAGPASVNAGEVVTYTITATNMGPSNATNTTITDAVPATLTNVSWTATASGAASVSSGASGTGNSVSVAGNIAAGAGNSINITITGTVPASSAPTSFQNWAVGTPSEPGIPAVNSDTVTTTLVRKPGLLITKGAPANAYGGSTIQYGIRVLNVGPSDAIGATIVDTIPGAAVVTNWTAVSGGGAVINSGASGTGNIININADIPAGESNYILVLVTAKIKSDFTGQIVNTARVIPAEPGAPSAMSNVTTNVTAYAKLEIRKAGPATITAGSNIQYTVEVVNHGPSNTNGVSITDNIPTGILNATWTATATGGATITSGNTGTGNIALVANIPDSVDAKITIVVSGQVDPSFTGSTIINTAKVLNPTGIPPIGDSTTVTTTVSRVADLQIVKTGAANQGAGEPTQYSLRITNAGPSNAVGVHITDVIPASILTATWTATASGNATNISPANGTGNVDLTADIPADGSAVTVVINGITNPASLNGSTITNTGNVSFQPGIPITDPVLSNNSSTVSSTVDNDPVVRIAKSGPATANVGDTITYQIEVRNGGSGNITGALITDNVPADIVVYNWTASATGTAVITGATSGTNNAVSTTGDIPVGTANTLVVTIKGVVSNTVAAQVTNTATVVAGTNKQSSVVTTINNNADVSIIKSGPATAIAGNGITYTLIVANHGPRDANTVQIQDVIPAAITSVTWSAVATGNASIMGSPRIDSSGNTIDMPVSIAAGASNYITFTITGTVAGGASSGAITNTANAVVTGVTDINPSNNTSSVTTVIGKQYGVTLQKGGPTTVVAGNSITYTIQVGNEGPSDVTGLNISDIIPAAVTNASWTVLIQGAAAVTGPFSGTGNVNTTADIPAGSGNLVVITVVGTIDPSATGTVTNVATASATGITPVSDTVVTHITRLTQLDVRKTGPAKVTAGVSMTYTIRVTNNGPSNARGVVITDTIDSRLTNINWQATGGNGAVINSGGTGTTPQISVNADIPAGSGAYVMIMVTGTVLPSATGTIINTATATPADSGNVPAVSPPVNTIIESKPMLNIRKSGPSFAAAGAPVSYVLMITNNGASNATGALIQDAIPAGITQVTWKASSSNGSSITTDSTGTGNNIQLKANIPPQGNIMVNIMGTIDPAYSGTITNTGIVQPAEPGVAGDTSSIQTTVNQTPGVEILKMGPSQLQSGQPISYTITALNNGPSNALNAIIRDIVPSAIQQVTWSATAQGAASIVGGGTGTGNNVQVTGNIPVGSSNSITIIINGTTSSSFRDTLRNMATITPAETGVPDSSVVVQTVVQGLPVLTISKTGPSMASSGDSITYNITVRNTSTSDAVNFNVTDAVPASITGVSWSTSTTGAASISSGSSGTGNAISLTGNLPAGAGNTVNIRVKGLIPFDFIGTLTNTAIVTPAESGTTPQSSSISTTVPAGSINNNVQLNISKTGPATMVRGTQATYVINVSNSGAKTASNVVITDAVPNVLTNVTWTTTTKNTATIAQGATGTGNAVNVVATIPGIDTSGIQIVVTGTVRSDAPTGTVTNVANAVFSGVQTTSNPVQSMIGSQADLSIQKTGSTQVYIGQTITYNLLVVNEGPSSANGAVVQDVLPAGLLNPAITILSATNGAANVVPAITNGTATVTINTFPILGAVSVQITGTASAAGTYSNTAIVNTPAGLPDPDSSNNISNTVVTTVLPKAQLDVNKSVSPAGPYQPGQQITYTLSVTNHGQAGVNPVVVTDTLPPATVLGTPTYTNPPRGTVTLNNGVLIWNVGLLNAGETLTWSYTATIIGKASIRNIAIVTGPPDVTIPDTSEVTISSARFANLKVTKQLNTLPPLKVGQTLQFTVTATNQGPDTATNVIMVDQLERELGMPLTITPSAGNAVYDAASRTISWTIAALPSGQTATLQFTLKLISGGDVGNTATISGNEVDPDLSDNTFTITRVPITGDDIFIPNVITPNGDGKNDYWVIEGLDRYPGSGVFIYNRWGNQVYQNKNYDNKWNGDGLNEGTYYYILKLNSPTQGVREYKGWIELLR